LKQYAQTTRDPGPVILISDLYTATYEEGILALLHSGHPIVVLHLLSSEDVSPPLETMGGTYQLRDAETGETCRIEEVSGSVAAYRNRMADYQDALHRFCRKNGVKYLRTLSSQVFERILWDLLSSLQRTRTPVF
jgi:hypothetical protein